MALAEDVDLRRRPRRSGDAWSNPKETGSENRLSRSCATAERSATAGGRSVLECFRHRAARQTCQLQQKGRSDAWDSLLAWHILLPRESEWQSGGCEAQLLNAMPKTTGQCSVEDLCPISAHLRQSVDGICRDRDGSSGLRTEPIGDLLTSCPRPALE